MLKGLMEASLASCGYFKSPARLQACAQTLARLSGHSAAQAEVIGQASALCDLGMIAMPRELLSRDGPLSPTERAVMQQHTLIGADLLAEVDHPVLLMASSVAAHHHERVDGSGYPLALEGKDIPPEARITSVASIYVAITQPRPFRKQRSHSEAVALIKGLGGSHLDQSLVDLFLLHEDIFERIV